MSVFEQVKLLYDSQLWGDVKILTSVLLTLGDHNPEMITMSTKYQTLVYEADAHYTTADYKKAEALYHKALQVKKMLNKTKGKGQNLDVTGEVVVKFQLHMCYFHQKQFRDAISILEGISTKQRNAKINMALAKLYQCTGMDRSAITNYKEVLRECPMSLEAAKGLLSLGVKGAEVVALMMNGLSSSANTEWLSIWVKGHAQSAGREYTNAVHTMKLLDNKPLLRDNIELLGSLGEAQFLNGDYGNAINTLNRAHNLDPLSLSHMDILAYLLTKEKKIKELGSLAERLISVSEHSPEPWVAMGYYCLLTKKGTRAVYFAQKGYSIDSRNLETLLLKGTALLELKRYQEALQHFREALRLAPHRYEAHKGLVDCYLASRRMREAISCAGQAYKSLGPNARSLTLYASVMVKEPLSLEKAKSYLEKAMKLDPTYLDAVYLMIDILDQQQHYDKGIELLRHTLREQRTCHLHQLLGEFLARSNEHQEALHQYNIALSMDPNNEQARQGMERVEKHSDVGMDTTYDVEVEDMEGSENEADLEGSDLEGAWSDIDVI